MDKIPTPKKKPHSPRDARISTGFDRFLLYEFGLLEEHRAFIEAHFTKSVSDFERRIQAEQATIGDSDEDGHYADYINEEYFTLAERLPRLQWNAQFLIVYSSFEDALNQLCKIVKNRSKHTVVLKDMAGSGIVRASIYLAKIAGVKAPFESDSWKKALLLGKLRNTIAHSNGNISVVDSSSIANSIKGLPGLTFKQVIVDQIDADIVLSSEFLQDAISTLHTVLADICNFELYPPAS